MFLPLSPLLLLNLWIIPNAALIALMWIWHLVNDGIGYVAWGILVGVESLIAMLCFDPDFRGPMDAPIVFGCWLALLIMVETGVWFVLHWRRNVWAREMFALSAENARRRAEREAARANGHPPDESREDAGLN
ncbi:MAG: hypothetical protein ABIQ96_04580 [Luteolibacter sp.]